MFFIRTSPQSFHRSNILGQLLIIGRMISLASVVYSAVNRISAGYPLRSSILLSK
ncbi:hypothetical protein LSO9J_100020 [Candidatus Liberibacter solanacearum]|uniref:hypothetical protein n=1 Tax=Candidatus Liberibacter solanacearum TaxID=556287 RepID=UPI003872380F